jgi:nucleotide-binding universal stress UspA family protein
MPLLFHGGAAKEDPEMLKTVAVAMTGFDSDRAALETAFVLGRPFEAHLQCLRIRPSTEQFISLLAAADMSGPIDSETFDALRQEDKTRTEAARRSFDEFRERWSVPIAESPPGPNGVTIAWEERLGDDVEELIAKARVHDVIVIARSPEFAGLSANAIGSILVGCGRPVLLAPNHAPGNLARTIAIAWKPSAEAARAVTSSMPLLEKASRIFVLAAAEGDRDPHKIVESAEGLRNQLRWHGLLAEVRSVVPGGREVSDAVMQTACDLGADMMVMGGYGHSRIRELVLGGFTRRVIREAPLPVLMFH